MSYREIEIIGSLMPEVVAPGTRIGNGNAVIERSVSAANVLAAIDDAARSGVNTLLIVVECLGGDADAAVEVYAALRRFARSGGRSIAFVQGRCASSAPLVAAACDFVLMRKDGKFALHAAHGDPGACARADDTYARLLHERTGMPVERLRGFMAEVDVLAEMHDLGAQRLGWCDWTPCTLEDARTLARMFAQGAQTPETPRTRRLAGLAHADKEPAPGLAAGAAMHQTQSSESTFVSTSVPTAEARRAETAVRDLTMRSTTAGLYGVAIGPAGLIAVGVSSTCLKSVTGEEFASSPISRGQLSRDHVRPRARQVHRGRRQ